MTMLSGQPKLYVKKYDRAFQIILLMTTPGGLHDMDVACLSLQGTQSKPFEDTKECH